MATLFNPSEEEINFETFMKPSSFFFRLVFFDFEPIKVNANRKEKCVYLAKIAYFILTVITLISIIASMITYLVVNWDNFENASSGVPNVFSTILVTLKVLLTFRHKKNLRSMFPELSEMFADRAKDNKKHKVKKYLVEFHRLMKIFSTPFLLAIFTFFVAIFPYLYNGTFMKPAIEYWYPFDAFQMETYPFAWIWNVWVAWNFNIYFLACDLLLFGLITVLVMEFDILKTDLSDVMMTPKDDRQKHFERLIDHHNKIFNLCDKLKKIYSLTFSFSVPFSSLTLCLYAFQISTFSNMVVTNYCFLIAAGSIIGGQILLLCFYGQKLISSSESLATGMHDCGWEISDDNQFNKQLILVMIRSQKATRFTAMGFADISLATFAQVSLGSFVHFIF